MALMAKTPILPEKREDLPREKKAPCSFKLILQLTLFGICALIVAYLYYGCNSKSNIQKWTQFFRIINSTKKEIRISETSKWQPLSGNLMCFVDTELGDDGQDQISATQKTWLTNCDNSQFFTYKPFTKSHGLSYRSIFQPLNIVQETGFWELVYGFEYAYKQLSSQFNWYINSQLDSYVFIDHLKRRLHRLDHKKPIVFISQTKHDQTGLTIVSNGAMSLFSKRLYGSDELCQFNGRSLEGFKKCFENIGIEVFDERNLKLHLLEFDNAKWIENLDHELATSSNLLAISGCDIQILYLIKLLTGDKNLNNFQNNTSLCNQ